MILDLDIWRCATVMIKHHGDSIDLEATRCLVSWR
jgi:hypothetical protein